MSTMEEAYSKLDQAQIDEIEEKFARADAAKKFLKLGVRKKLTELLRLSHGRLQIQRLLKNW